MRHRGLVAPAYVGREGHARAVAGPRAFERLARSGAAGIEPRRRPAVRADDVKIHVGAHALAARDEEDALAIGRPLGTDIVEFSFGEGALRAARDINDVQSERLATGVGDVRDACTVR